MTLVKFNPFGQVVPFDRFNHIDTAINDVLNRNINSFFSDEVKNWLTAPSVNILESEKEFTIEVAAPGLVKENFQLDVTKNVLTVSAEKKVENTTPDEAEVKTPERQFVRREFGYSTFKRSFTLPENVDAANISAQYTNGVLHVNVPKVEPQIVKHRITIA